jgi:alanyl-tRNA synthetase
MVRLEEERFSNTMTVGLGKLNELDVKGLDGDKLFLTIAKLYDTYGTPKDLIRVFLEEKGIVFEEDDYNARFDSALQDLQRQSGIGQTERKSQISPVYAEILEKVGANKFHGYETTHLEGAKVVAILDGDSPLDSLGEGSQGSIVLSETPFYAESGGQVGDVGRLASADASIIVSDTYSPVAGLIIHKVKVDKGPIKIGDEVVATVDAEKRDATRRNHTATHLLHAALKEVLGSHVKQAGSVVAPNYLRFDFTHYQPMTETEVADIEDLVNRYILENHAVNTNVMSIDEAMKTGAVALFGEKYGSDVRVLSVGDGIFSKELCGGTHVRATGDIGSFKITADEAIASGVRRIRAITGFDAFERFREDERLIDRSLGALKTQRDNLPNAIERLQDEIKRIRKEIDDLKLKIATGSIGGASSNGDEARDVAGVKVLAKIVEGLDANGTRQLSDTLLSRLKSGIVILGRETDGKVSIVVRVSDDLTGKVKAGNVINEIVPIVGGRGGGKPDMAEGGGTEPAKLPEAIEASYKAIEAMLS